MIKGKMVISNGSTVFVPTKSKTVRNSREKGILEIWLGDVQIGIVYQQRAKWISEVKDKKGHSQYLPLSNHSADKEAAIDYVFTHFQNQDINGYEVFYNEIVDKWQVINQKVKSISIKDKILYEARVLSCAVDYALRH